MARNNVDSVSSEACVANNAQQAKQTIDGHTNVFITPEGDIKYLCSVCGQFA